MNKSPELTFILNDNNYKSTAEWLKQFCDHFLFRIFYKNGKKTLTTTKITDVDLRCWYIEHMPNPRDSKIIYMPTIQIKAKKVYIDNINKIEVFRKR